MKTCKSCGKPNYNDGAKFCADCGGELIEKSLVKELFSNKLLLLTPIAVLIADLLLKWQYGTSLRWLNEVIFMRGTFIEKNKGIDYTMNVLLQLTPSFLWVLLVCVIDLVPIALFVLSTRKRSAAFCGIWLTAYAVEQIALAVFSPSHHDAYGSRPLYIVVPTLVGLFVIWGISVLLNKIYFKENEK